MKNILIVEDEKFVRLGIKTMIERMGICTGEIIECKNGEEALEMVKIKKFHLILTDIKMPVLDGLTFIERMEQLNIKQGPIIIISGYDDFSFAVEALHFGVREYLLKPIEPEIFYGMLNKIQAELDAQGLEGVNQITPTQDTEIDKRGKIESAIKLINQNYKSDINMAVVSNYVSMNYTFFSEAFKEIVGENFVDYIKSVRINVAKKLLNTTNIKIGKISEEVGFKEEKYFLKTFKAETGLTPTDYRNKNKIKELIYEPNER